MTTAVQMLSGTSSWQSQPAACHSSVPPCDSRLCGGETGSAAASVASGHVMTPAALPHHVGSMFSYTHVQGALDEQHTVSQTLLFLNQSASPED